MTETRTHSEELSPALNALVEAKAQGLTLDEMVQVILQQMPSLSDEQLGKLLKKARAESAIRKILAKPKERREL